MGYDAFLAATVAQELGELLTGRTLIGVRPTLGSDLLLTFGPRRTPAWVVLALGARPAAYGLEGEPDATIVEPVATPGLEAFLRLFEARLAGRSVGGVKSLPWERIVEFSLLPREGLRGDREAAFLVHEAAPKPSRLIILRGDHTVTAVWPAAGSPPPDTPAGPSRVGERQFRLGEPYRTPAATWTHTPAELARDHRLFDAALAAASREGLDLGDPTREPEPAWRLLLRAAPSLGPSIARSIVRQAGDAPLHTVFAEVVDRYLEGRFAPCLILPSGSTPAPADVLALPVDPAPGQVVLACPSACLAVTTWHQSTQTAAACDALAARIGRTVRTAVERTRRKVERQAEDLERTGEAEDLRLKGELLLANLRDVAPGQMEVTVEDYSERPVTIALDPRLSPARNAQRYFARYRKAQRAAGLDAPRQKSAHELAWLETVVFDLGRAVGSALPVGADPLSAVRQEVLRRRRSLDELLALEASLARAGYAGASGKRGSRSQGAGSHGRSAGSHGKGATAPAPGPRPGEPWRFETDDGLIVLAGRTARQNETVSLKLAQPRDIWLHARGCPGSHVLLRLPPGTEGSPPPRSLLQAAALAAHLSAARGGGKVSVDYTEARHLRRPRGAPPGLVLYDPHETVLVDTEKVALPRATEGPGAAQTPGSCEG